MSSEEKDYSQRIAKYMKMGWKLTEYSCPICGSLIVKKENDYFCPVCEKRVLVAEDEEEALDIYKKASLRRLESIILRRIDEMTSDDFTYGDLEILTQYIKLLKEIRELLSD